MGLTTSTRLSKRNIHLYLLRRYRTYWKHVVRHNATRSPILRLPFEIREQIYFLALTPLDNGHYQDGPHTWDYFGYWDQSEAYSNSLIPPGGLYVSPPLRDPNSWIDGASHWGTERMTRLLRVCMQIYFEARKVLFENFYFPLGILLEPIWSQVPQAGYTVALNSIVTRLSLESASLVRNIGVGTFALWSMRSWEGLQFRDFLEEVAFVFPKARKVIVTIELFGQDFEKSRSEIKEQVRELVLPLTAVKYIELRSVGGRGYKPSQKQERVDSALQELEEEWNMPSFHT